MAGAYTLLIMVDLGIFLNISRTPVFFFFFFFSFAPGDRLRENKSTSSSEESILRIIYNFPSWTF